MRTRSVFPYGLRSYCRLCVGPFPKATATESWTASELCSSSGWHDIRRYCIEYPVRC